MEVEGIDSSMVELIYNIWFHGLHIKRWEKLSVLRSNISCEDFYRLKLKDYVNLGFDIINAEKIENSKNIEKYEEINNYMLKEEIKYTLYSDNEYPDSLRDIPDPPVGLFIKGNFPMGDNKLAVVGARKSSEYGKTVAYKFAYELAAKGIDIVSGMARGIDTCSHRGSLDANGRTIAVMGSGFKNIYPSENKKLFEQISSNGCIITEYLPDVQPFPQNFPERNRIISGLSKYVLIVEASEKSGSLITAGLALDQGKDVFAVPGNIFSPISKGCNNLIRDGAKIITCIEDILEEFKLTKNNINYDNFNLEEKSIISLLKCGGLNIDSILENTDLSPNSILSSLSKLECRGIIKKAYGSYYILC